MSDPIAEAYQKGRADLLAELRAGKTYYYDMQDGLYAEERGMEDWKDVLDSSGEIGCVFEVEEHSHIATLYAVRMSELDDGGWEDRRFDTSEDAEAWITERRADLDKEKANV